MHAVEHKRANKASKEGPQARNTYFSRSILQIPGAIKRPRSRAIHAIGGPDKRFFAWFYINAIFKIMVANEGGDHIFKKMTKRWKKGACKAWNAKKKTTDCIQNSQTCKRYAYHRFCKRGMEAKAARDCSHRLFLTGGKKRTHSEPNEKQSNKSKQKWQNIIFLKPCGGQKKDFFDRMYSKSFFRNVLPAAARSTFFKHVMQKMS